MNVRVRKKTFSAVHMPRVVEETNGELHIWKWPWPTESITAESARSNYVKKRKNSVKTPGVSAKSRTEHLPHKSAESDKLLGSTMMLTLKIAAAGVSETLVCVYQTTRRHIPRGRSKEIAVSCGYIPKGHNLSTLFFPRRIFH